MLTAADLPANLADIQGLLLRGYRLPAASYIFLRVTDGARARALLGQLRSEITPASVWDRKPDLTCNLAFTRDGLTALGAPQALLDSLPEEFRLGMPARQNLLGDSGESAPAQWEPPLRGPGLHALVIIFAKDAVTRDDRVNGLRAAAAGTSGGVEVLYQQDAHSLDTGTEHFGYRDAIGQPQIEGVDPPTPGEGTPAADGAWQPLKIGEFVLGYQDESQGMEPLFQPEGLARNGSFLVWRKLHQKVADFRQFLRENSADYDPELFAAKLVGRWRSGAPLIAAPTQDDPSLAADPARNNNFRYQDDPKGMICPRGAHIRRANPRDALDGQADVVVRRHRILRRGTSYGPWLATDEDDGADRGVVFVVVAASIARQFEFVQNQWMNQGSFAGLDDTDKDPLVGDNDGTGKFVIQGTPPRFAFHLPRFVTMRGGAYFFAPSLSALAVIAENRWDGTGST